MVKCNEKSSLARMFCDAAKKINIPSKKKKKQVTESLHERGWTISESAHSKAFTEKKKQQTFENLVC